MCLPFHFRTVTLNRAHNVFEENLFFNNIRVKGELKRVYINGCRYNERLNTETEGSCYDVPTLYTVRIDTGRSLDRHDYTHSMELPINIQLDVCCLFCLLY